MPTGLRRSQVSENRLLAALEEADFVELAARMAITEVDRGAVLIGQGAAVTEVHFPLTADLSNLILFANGQAIETSSVGRLGVSGLAAFLARAPCAWEVRVQASGIIVRLPADVLRARALISSSLMMILLTATHDDQAEGAQTAACNVSHDVQSRLARWLLMLDDRTGARVLTLSHEDIAQMLGVQRSAVSVAAVNLKKSGAINYTRSNIVITDRNMLRRLSCECYEAQENRKSMHLTSI